ncbi:polysaccharide deacetylase [Niveibacterium umoris]|uniref:Peptidoglycan/xylan/chitin deacetylase (PgdA/CDA1 family) n=1 Tax=Niveibacterium umoris TaxID=1193620 RepID=A0A840BK04_9RHOO|nr:polysaccharide deacetylase [Niveibacterium umoris]MBB4013585.1 peptidoglycan/xylan/chitin deacetylase (PgdA/CDA1 family) [Niveibacterium umoris]
MTVPKAQPPVCPAVTRVSPPRADAPCTDVVLGFDVEVWADGWGNVDATVGAAFRRRIYGHSRESGAGLQAALRILSENGLHAVFFVEPLFAARVGESYLAEIVELILRHGQEVQLHMHAEWAYELRDRQFRGVTLLARTRNISDLPVEAQRTAIRLGLDLVEGCGAPRPIAFRAGSYYFRRETLGLLAENGIRFDSSLNLSESRSGPDLGEYRVPRVSAIDGLIEVPIAQVVPWVMRARQAQIGGCGLAELTRLVRHAADTQSGPVVIVSHNNEMLHRVSGRPDAYVVRRFEAFCRWLSRTPGIRTTGFTDMSDAVLGGDVPVLRHAPLANLARDIEQRWRRWRYY